MKLLLHACCADCTLKFLESAKTEDLETTIYYYNPNIHPRAEYTARLKAMQQITTENKVKIIVPDWKPKEYFKEINDQSERPNRCIRCWNLRLGITAKFASENGFDIFSSTLISSQYQDWKKIEEIAVNMAKKYKINFWRPETINCDLKTSGFYKQFFCGCVYSMKERYEEKYKVK